MLSVEDAFVRFGRRAALSGVSLHVAAGEILCLLGRSGSGKSTLLRVVAGIERLYAGRVVIDDVAMDDAGVFVEPEDRRVGMVFQDYALFPHLTVAANAAFGIRDDDAAARGLLERFGLGGYADCYPHSLSGGEQQRLALARAMAPRPRLLLLDEPFSSLDGRLRDDVRRHTIDVLRESRTTCIIVTHDPDEALRIADRIALLEEGRLIQHGTPEDVYGRPGSLAAVRFFGTALELPGICRAGRVETSLGSFTASQFDEGSTALACLRPEHVRIVDRPTSIRARVVRSEFSGDCRHVQAAVDGLGLSLSLHAASENAIEPGASIHLEIRPDRVPVVAIPEDYVQ